MHDEEYNKLIIKSVMKEARLHGLEREVRATVMKLMKEYPELSKGLAYHYAALEWDI
jgi:hypothetical protein